MPLLSSIPASGLALAAVGPALIYRFLIYPMLISPLAGIPNAHWSSSISPVWILCTRFRHRENRVLLEAHRRLGPIIRVGPNELSIDDVDLVRTVYGGGFDKTEWYSVFDNYGSVIHQTNPSSHLSRNFLDLSGLFLTRRVLDMIYNL